MMLDTISNVLMLILLFIYVIHSASGQSPMRIKCLITYRLIADPNDWVNVNYIVQRNAATDKAATVNAQTSIANGASSTAKQGPWSLYTLFDIFMYSDLFALSQLSRIPRESYHPVKILKTT